MRTDDGSDEDVWVRAQHRTEDNHRLARAREPLTFLNIGRSSLAPTRPWAKLRFGTTSECLI